MNMNEMTVPDHVPADLVRPFNLFEFEGSSEDVHKAWRKVIDEEPEIFFSPLYGGYWVLNRAELLEEAWPDADRFSSGIGGVGIPPTPASFPPMLPIDSDGPFHKTLRRPLNIALSPKAVKTLSVRARELAKEMVEKIAPKGECDFVSEFSLVMPMELFLGIVELPSSDREYLLGLAHDAIKGPDIERRFEAMNELFGYVERHVRERDAKPGDDLISKIVTMTVEDGRSLTHEEKIGYVAQILLGGLDTVGGTMAMIAKYLAENPVQRAEIAKNIAEDPKPVEELLRRFSIPTVGRVVTRDIEFHGISMKSGDRVMLPTMVHGLDGSRWDDAMHVDLSRPAQDHMAFGNGVHRCPGANLARAEIRIFLEEWLNKIPEFSIHPQKSIKYQSGPVAGLMALPIIWSV